MNLSQKYDQIIDLCQTFIRTIDDQNSKIIVILDNDRQWLDVIKRKTRHNQNVITISDTEEFRSFVMLNGCSKMYIDINMDKDNGVDLAEELNLKDCFGELVFVSSEAPSEDESARIDAMGSRFLSKSELIDKIIYPDPNNKEA